MKPVAELSEKELRQRVIWTKRQMQEAKHIVGHDKNCATCIEIKNAYREAREALSKLVKK